MQRPHNYIGMGHMPMPPFHGPGMHGPGGMHYDGMIYGMMGAGMGPGEGRPPEAFSYPDAAFMAQPQAFNPEYMHAYNAPMASPAFMMLERGRMHHMRSWLENEHRHLDRGEHLHRVRDGQVLDGLDCSSLLQLPCRILRD